MSFPRFIGQTTSFSSRNEIDIFSHARANQKKNLTSSATCGWEIFVIESLQNHLQSSYRVTGKMRKVFSSATRSRFWQLERITSITVYGRIMQVRTGHRRLFCCVIISGPRNSMLNKNELQLERGMEVKCEAKRTDFVSHRSAEQQVQPGTLRTHRNLC